MSKGYKVTCEENTIEIEKVKENKPTKAFGIISMVLGLLSLLENFISLPFFVYPIVLPSIF